MPSSFDMPRWIGLGVVILPNLVMRGQICGQDMWQKSQLSFAQLPKPKSYQMTPI
jgi:hypothetical protein